MPCVNLYYTDLTVEDKVPMSTSHRNRCVILAGCGETRLGALTSELKRNSSSVWVPSLLMKLSVESYEIIGKEKGGEEMQHLKFRLPFVQDIQNFERVLRLTKIAESVLVEHRL